MEVICFGSDTKLVIMCNPSVYIICEYFRHVVEIILMKIEFQLKHIRVQPAINVCTLVFWYFTMSGVQLF